MDVEELKYSQLHALSLAKSGDPEGARELLERVFQKNQDDPETAGILGGIYKTLFHKHEDTALALLARDTYLQNFNKTQSYYTGINAASMSAMLMQASKSRELAKKVLELISLETEDFWELATLGEAFLLIKEKDKALAYFLKSRKIAHADWGKMNSVYNQLWLLNHYLPVPQEIIKLFTPPTVAAFVGHMIDRPDRETSRFPASLEGEVKMAISGALKSLNARIGYCSLACGGDILFAEAMDEMGGEVNLFLPFDEKDFIRESVAFAGESWVNRYYALVKKFPVTYCSQGSFGGCNDLFSLQSMVIFGSSFLRSLTLRNEPTLVSLLSETDLSRKEGGTRHTLGYWPFPGKMVNINPDHYLKDFAPSVTGGVKENEIHPPSNCVLVFLLYVTGFPLTLLEDLDEAVLKGVLNPVVQRKDEGILLGFSNGMALGDAVQVVKDFFSNQGLKVRMSLHAGVIPFGSWENLAMDTLPPIQILMRINECGTEGTCLATATVAKVLALQLKRFSVHESGWIGQEEKLEVYSITSNS